MSASVRFLIRLEHRSNCIHCFQKLFVNLTQHRLAGKLKVEMYCKSNFQQDLLEYIQHAPRCFSFPHFWWNRRYKWLFWFSQGALVWLAVQRRMDFGAVKGRGRHRFAHEGGTGVRGLRGVRGVTSHRTRTYRRRAEPCVEVLGGDVLCRVRIVQCLRRTSLEALDRDAAGRYLGGCGVSDLGRTHVIINRKVQPGQLGQPVPPVEILFGVQPEYRLASL
ncbi:hypothetical protein BDW69DRAFT_164953 [Aspergillus filifer]